MLYFIIKKQNSVQSSEFDQMKSLEDLLKEVKTRIGVTRTSWQIKLDRASLTIVGHLEYMFAIAGQAAKTFQDETGESVDFVLEKSLEKIKNIMFTKEMQEALDTISSSIEKLKQFDLEAKQYGSPLFLLFAILKRVQADIMREQAENLADENETTFLPNQIFSMKRIGNYALNVYDASWALTKHGIAKTMLIEEEDILYTWFKDESQEAHCPKFILFKDDELESIILSIRGTFSIKDVVTDVVCVDQPFLDGHAHKGLVKGALQIITLVQESLKSAVQNHPGFKVVLTGHSLGAGTAELIYLELTLGASSNILPPGTKVECLALAPPPVYRSSTELPDKVQDSIKIIIFNNDLVPRLSLGNIANLLVKLRSLDDLNIPIISLISILINKISKEEEEHLQGIRDTLEKAQQTQFPHLQHPGRILHFKRIKQQIRPRSEDSSIFSTTILLLEGSENLLTTIDFTIHGKDNH
ncbi:uncharacterized protein LOC111703874 [Eurytemora carolleeae]|uniref:uncharacterized protein LOC111703874 n=1 Tax=Eurytemora carolleeae TaxID=1294199 RepID=UPI000C788F53|nr:uncharacterized protein LOC111703874 [Eurytemora carolleeae]|eukprot:XP_023331719.1 uncharacterized protein LOC111703874 [Eurytemora affinis]